MKFAFSSPLTDLSGRVILDENGNPVPLANLIVQSLIAADKEDVDGQKKFARYKLAVKVEAGDDIDITEAATIKEVTAKVLTPLPLGRIWDLLENPLPK